MLESAYSGEIFTVRENTEIEGICPSDPQRDSERQIIESACAAVSQYYRNISDFRDGGSRYIAINFSMLGDSIVSNSGSAMVDYRFACLRYTNSSAGSNYRRIT